MGMRLAARLLLLAAAVCSGSCLVVSDPDFRGQEDCIPFFVTQQADPPIADKKLILASAGDAPEFRGTIPMRSCALIKNYEMRIFLDGAWQSLATVAPTGDEERNVSVLVNLPSGGKRGCHEIEVYLSTRFSAIDPRVPENPDDLAYVLWRYADTTDAKFANCGLP